jgi:ABC-type Na+ efflux pump permease subunit
MIMKNEKILDYLLFALYLFGAWFIGHAGIMLVPSIADKTEDANMLSHIPVLFLVALVFWYLMPKQDSVS